MTELQFTLCILGALVIGFIVGVISEKLENK